MPFIQGICPLTWSLNIQETKLVMQRVLSNPEAECRELGNAKFVLSRLGWNMDSFPFLVGDTVPVIVPLTLLALNKQWQILSLRQS